MPDHTPERYNQRVEAETTQRVQLYAQHPRGIDARLNELDEEWDIERTLEANAAALALSGTLLGAFVDRRFLALPALVSFFLLQHAIQGWCPPLSFFRRRGRAHRARDRHRAVCAESVARRLRAYRSIDL